MLMIALLEVVILMFILMDELRKDPQYSPNPVNKSQSQKFNLYVRNSVGCLLLFLTDTFLISRKILSDSEDMWQYRRN